jgi:hypothetical protein
LSKAAATAVLQGRQALAVRAAQGAVSTHPAVRLPQVPKVTLRPLCSEQAGVVVVAAAVVTLLAWQARERQPTVRSAQPMVLALSAQPALATEAVAAVAAPGMAMAVPAELLELMAWLPRLDAAAVVVVVDRTPTEAMAATAVGIFR